MSDIFPARDFGQTPGGQRIDLLTGSPQWGPMTFETNTAMFGPNADPTLGIGYNYGYGGNKPMPNEASMYWMVEGNYDRSHAGIPDAVMEQYWEATSADRSIQWRPIFAMADKSAASNDRDTFIKALDFYGPAPTGGGTGSSGGIRMFSAKDGPSMQSDELTYVFSRGGMRMEGFSDYDTTIAMRAGATKNAIMQFGSQGIDNAMSIGTAAPHVGYVSVGPQGAQMRFTAVNSGKGLSVGINAGSRSTAALDVDLKGTWANEVGVRVRQQEGGSGNLLQAENSAGIVGSGLDRSGYFFTQLNAAPSPAEVRAGEADFWFDATPGAAKLVVTARDTGGTLLTGSVPLLPSTAQPSPVTPPNLGYDPVDGANILSLGAGDDTVGGLDTLDIIFGGPGNDTLSGNGGNDLLYGGLGADTLIGGEGNDLLWGDGGNDKLTGGNGADTYGFAASSGVDLITGFSQAEGDRLALNGQSYVTGADDQGNLTLTLSGGGAVTLQGVPAATPVTQNWFS